LVLLCVREAERLWRGEETTFLRGEPRGTTDIL